MRVQLATPAIAPATTPARRAFPAAPAHRRQAPKPRSVPRPRPLPKPGAAR
ncbi:hypothetical protein [Streptosporangium sp. NPDC000396]|uniref:hypothetical protein n=1 Tax=Streptosporangium sp. NPDC000396 TaxID=3366185 RepID=UPI00367C37F1